MSRSDWIRINDSYTGDSATLNSSLSNPLSIGGSYCRRLPAASLGSVNIQIGYTLSQTYSGGQFYNIQNDKAVRITGYIRVESHQSSQENSIFLGIKVPDIGGNSLLGYGLGIVSSGTINTQNICLYTNGNRTDFDSVSLDTWYGFRLEVYPIGASADRIIAYKESSPGSGIWSVITDTTIPNSSGNYVSWGGNKRIGFSTNTAYFPGSITGYVDLVTCEIAAAPSVIP